MKSSKRKTGRKILTRLHMVDLGLLLFMLLLFLVTQSLAAGLLFILFLISLILSLLRPSWSPPETLENKSSTKLCIGGDSKDLPSEDRCPCGTGPTCHKSNSKTTIRGSQDQEMRS